MVREVQPRPNSLRCLTFGQVPAGHASDPWKIAGQWTPSILREMQLIWQSGEYPGVHAGDGVDPLDGPALGNKVPEVAGNGVAATTPEFQVADSSPESGQTICPCDAFTCGDRLSRHWLGCGSLVGFCRHGDLSR